MKINRLRNIVNGTLIVSGSLLIAGAAGQSDAYPETTITYILTCLSIGLLLIATGILNWVSND